MNPRLIQLFGVMLCCGLVLGSYTFTPTINDGRKQLQMIGAADLGKSAPPEYAFAVQALGAFRGLLTNIAFIRHEQYKMQGRFYDAMQLASWISKLQPRFVSVWEFLAWNMAWNISVTTYTPEERWNWVYNGVKLLRDEGLRYNPRSVNLHRQVAWIFVNKMSESVDEFHMTYKRNWAWRMHLVLGPPPDPMGDYRPDEAFEALQSGVGSDVDVLKLATSNERRKREAARAARERGEAGAEVTIHEITSQPTTVAVAASQPTQYEIVKKAFYDYLASIADAPDTLEGLYARRPKTREMVARLRSIDVRLSDDELSEDEYWREEGLAFRFFYPYRLLTEPRGLLERMLKDRPEDRYAALVRPLGELLGDAESPDAVALVRFVQKKVLREVYKLNATTMAQLTARFGPMDWRSVDAQSLYWVNEGLVAGNETISSFKNDKTNTTRLIFFSLRNLFLRNRISFEPFTTDVNRAYLNQSPDLNFIEPMNKAFEEYGRDIDPDPGPYGGVGETFRSGHVNFLSEAIRLLYFAGREREAAHYYEYLRQNYSRTSTGEINPLPMKPLEDFVMDDWRDQLDSVREVRNMMYALWVNAFAALQDGNLSMYNLMVRRATELHTFHNKDRMTESRIKDRLEPLFSIQCDVLKSILAEPSVSWQQTVVKARLWKYLPLNLRHAVYDDVADKLKAECDAVGFGEGAVAEAFPEPAGMDKYREQNPREGLHKRDPGVDTLTQPQ